MARGLLSSDRMKAIVLSAVPPQHAAHGKLARVLDEQLARAGYDEIEHFDVSEAKLGFCQGEFDARSCTMSIKNKALKELALARDKARLQIHLPSMDARDGWQELEEKLDALEQSIARTGERTTEVGLATAHHIAQSVKEFFKGHESAQSQLSKPVRSIMNQAVSACFPEDSLNEAARLLWETNCGAIPVVTRARNLVGIITDRDICMASYIQGRHLADLPVERVMSNVVYSCTEDEPITRVFEIMQKHRVRRVPVIHEDGQLVGMVSLADLVRWVQSQQLGRAFVRDALTKVLAAISEAPVDVTQQSCAAE